MRVNGHTRLKWTDQDTNPKERYITTLSRVTDLIGDESGELITQRPRGCTYWRRAPGIVTTSCWTYFEETIRRSTATYLFPDHNKPMNIQRGK